jgi:DNA-binding MarR family transcriptional regulator
VIGDLPGGPRGYQIVALAASGLPGTQLALAQQLGVDRTVMTYLLDDLEKAGLIERQPDPADRRARRITATRQGRARAVQLHTQLARAEDKLLAGLDADERTQFRALLRRLATHADAADPGPTGCAAVREILRADTPAACPPPADAR